MRPWPLLILALFTVSCASNGSPPGAGPGAPGTPAIPEGRPPRLDGILDDGEWDGAQDVALSSGGMLSLMRDGDRLYLALRMDNKYAEPTLFLGYEDEGRVAVEDREDVLDARRAGIEMDEVGHGHLLRRWRRSPPGVRIEA